MKQLTVVVHDSRDVEPVERALRAKASAVNRIPAGSPIARLCLTFHTKLSLGEIEQRLDPHESVISYYVEVGGTSTPVVAAAAGGPSTPVFTVDTDSEVGYVRILRNGIEVLYWDID